MAHDLFGDVGPGDTWVLLHVVAHFGAGFRERGLKFLLLIVTELKVGGKSLYFSDDLITLFLCKVHSNPPVVGCRLMVEGPEPNSLILVRVRLGSVVTWGTAFHEGGASVTCLSSRGKPAWLWAVTSSVNRIRSIAVVWTRPLLTDGLWGNIVQESHGLQLIEALRWDFSMKFF